MPRRSPHKHELRVHLRIPLKRPGLARLGEETQIRAGHYDQTCRMGHARRDVFSATAATMTAGTLLAIRAGR